MGSSDTVFGLLANTTAIGFSNLNSIKQRAEKPYIILINHIDKLKHFVSIERSDSVLNLLKFCWPGPLTVIFKAKDDLPAFLKSQDHKVAIRVPQHAGLLQLLASFEGLFSTSANLAGDEVPGLIEGINTKIIDKIDLIVLDRYNAGYANTSQPSTILDCSTGQIRVIRVGAYSIDSLVRICGGPILY